MLSKVLSSSVAARGASRSMSSLVGHGNVPLVNRMVDEAEAARVISSANHKISISDRASCEAEQLMVGGYSPIDSFMNQETFMSVLDDMRLPKNGKTNGELFPVPVVLDTIRDDLKAGDKVVLDYNGEDIAMVEVEEVFSPDKPYEALKTMGTSSLEHPGTRMIAMERGPKYISGQITGLKIPTREFPCATPLEVRASLPQDGRSVIAFQCRNPIHRAHYELFMRSLDDERVTDDAVVLVHPTCGPTQEDDIPGNVRYQTYLALQEQLNDDRVNWAYLPYNMKMCGPREALMHMIIRKNYGCNAFIVGRDMAGSKSSITGEDFYGAYDAQDIAIKYQDELGVMAVPSLNLVYTEEEEYVTADYAEQKGYAPKKLSGTKFRQMLRGGEDIPEWFAFKSVVEVLRKYQ